MRLVCPNCGAQYEVPAEVISAEGRDVQCSNCGITWYQPSPDAEAEGEMPGEVAEDFAAEGELEDDGALEDEADLDAAEDAPGGPYPDYADELEEIEDAPAAEAGPPVAEDAPEADPFETRFDDDFDDGFDDEDLGEEFGEDSFADEAYEEDYDEDLAAPPGPDPDLAAAVAEDPEAEDPEAEDGYLDEPELDEDFPEDGYPEGDAPDAAAQAARVTPRRALSPDVQSVLQAEAAYEARARSRAADPLESQPDLGLGEPETEAQRRERESRERLARLRGMTAMTGAAAGADAAVPKPAPPPPPPEPDPVTDPAAAPRRDLLPDIEEINSSLRSKGQKAQPAGAAVAEIDPREQRRGFRLGFGLVLLLGALLILYYMYAGWVRSTFPALAETTDAYVDVADSFRAWLDARAAQLQQWMEGMSE